jgi:hypothetical protein
VAWVLRLVKIDAEGVTDVMAIERPGDLANIADLGDRAREGGLALPETKRLPAGLQQEIVAAEVRDHAVRRPACPRCGVVCRVKDCHVRFQGFRTQSPTRLCLFRFAG